MAERVLTGRWVRVPNVVWRRFFDGVVVLGPVAERPIRVTAPGRVIWEQLAVPLEIDSLVEAVAHRVGMPAAQVHDDVVTVVRALVEVGAVAPA